MVSPVRRAEWSLLFLDAWESVAFALAEALGSVGVL